MNFLNLFCILNRRINLQAIANNSGIAQQFFSLGFFKPGDFGNIEILVSLVEILFFIKYRGPSQLCLVDLPHQSAKYFWMSSARLVD